MDMATEIKDLIDSPAPVPNDRDDLIIQIENLNTKLEDVVSYRNSYQRQLSEIQMKVDAVKGFIADLYSMNGEIDDDIKQIAEYLDIELTKSITGTATFEISFTAEVPLDFDTDDFELSFDVNCDSYEADNFEWSEENVDVDCEDEF